MISKFKLGAVKWKIVINNEKLDYKQRYGESDYDTSTITLQTKSLKENRTETAIEHTLYHEVVHAILDTMEERELSNNEKFVQQFSLLLHQFEKTKE